MTDRDSASVALRSQLEEQFNALGLLRPFKRACYDPGHHIEYDITGVVPANQGTMTVEVERFVGGGFAGQVYRVKLLSVDGKIEGLETGKHYAIKILKPPSGLACVFRNFLYFVAYQTHFAAQVHPDAVRVGVLWQKLIRRAAAKRFSDPEAVCNTFATFYDAEAKSFGEINEWIDGRIWKFEMDDELFDRWNFDGEVPPGHNSAEYVSKRKFMDELVSLLHQMGAGELARQYEWWTMKSQPNALKRTTTDASPCTGVTAIDFRAGLTLLPFLPMSPADFGLIIKGLFRGRIVQFDRSDPRKFNRFIQEHQEDFSGLEPAIEELTQREVAYRASMPDVTHHHFRLLVDSRLRSSVKRGIITGWRNLGRIDERHAQSLEKRTLLFWFFYMVCCVPFLGKRVVKLWGHDRARQHLVKCLTSFNYFRKAVQGESIETLIVWQRDGRMRDDRIIKYVHRPVRYWVQRILLGWLPARWHRFLTELSYAWETTRDAISYTVKFLRVPEFREECLIDQVSLGREEGMLSHDEAERIEREIKDPYIQKYLRCLAVHVCTVPVTQVVMVLVGGAVVAYCTVYRQMSWAESMAYGAAAAAAIQLMPISPGSIARGLFVIYMMIKDRDWRNYYIAAPVSFIHVVGYLAFPLQMASHNPALARFLAGRWAKNLVHVVPVFGERGGLLEHWIFDFFFNLPLSIKRAFRTEPVRCAVVTAVTICVLAGIGFLAYCRVWEYCQPQERLEKARVSSIVPYSASGGDVHWTSRGMRVHFEGRDEPVDYPSDNWDESVGVGDTADAVIRKSFFGNEYDGLAISKQSDVVRLANGTGGE